MAQYPDGFKARMVERMAAPHGISAAALSRELEMDRSVLSRWLRQARKVANMSNAKDSPKSPRSWSAVEKFNAVVEAAGLSDADLGAFLRKKGIRDSDLIAWRKLILSGLDGKPATTISNGGAQDRRIKQLEKRLSATEALLDLQKKVRALWGDEDSPTTSKKES